MTLDLEDRLWEQLEAAAARETARGRISRFAAAAHAALPMWRLRVTALGLAAAAAAVALLLALAPDRDHGGWRTDRVELAGEQLSTGAAGFGAFWSYDARSGQVFRLDARTHRLIARIPVPAPPTDLALTAGRDAVWAVASTSIRHSAVPPAAPHAAALLKIDPRTNRVTTRILLRGPNGATMLPVDLLVRQNAVWVWGQGGVQRVDPLRGRVVLAIRLPDERIMGFAATADRVTVATELSRLVSFDARTGGQIGDVPLDGPAGAQKLVAVGDAVVAYQRAGTLVSIDPVSERRQWSVRVGSRPQDLALIGGRLWTLMGGNELRALDPGTGRTVARVALPVDDALTIASTGATPLVTTQSGQLISVRAPAP